MWLRDFLCKDLPHCRTIIYGYNSKLTSHGVDTIMDYGRGLLEELKKVRSTEEVSKETALSYMREHRADRHDLLATTTAALLRRAQLWRHHTRPCRFHTHKGACISLSSCTVSCESSPDDRR
jgi:hypothetical protein